MPIKMLRKIFCSNLKLCVRPLCLIDRKNKSTYILCRTVKLLKHNISFNTPTNPAWPLHTKLTIFKNIFIDIYLAIRRLNKYILYAKGLSKGTQATQSVK